MRLLFPLLFIFCFAFSNEKIELSEDEKDFINKTYFNVSITKNWYPFSFKDSSNEALGISSEYWKIIVNSLNLKTNNIFFNSFDEQVQSLKDGKSDIIFSAGEIDSRKKFAQFSNEYLNFPISIATKKDQNFIENIEEIIDKKVAVGNNFTSHHVLKEKYPNLELILVNSVEDGLKLVSEDKAFAFVDIKPVLSYNISKFDFNDLKISGNIGSFYSLRIMVRNEHKELIPIINKAIKNISNNQVIDIVNSWSNVKFQTSEDYTIIWFLVIVLFLGAAAFVHRSVSLNILNQKLKDIVYRKTKELKSLNENLQNIVDDKTKELLEKESILSQQTKMAAMGEMLENIAHQWRQPLSIISTLVTSMKLKKELGILSDEEFIKGADIINNSVQHLSSTIDDFRNFFKLEKETAKFDVSNSIEKALHLVVTRIENNNIKIVKNLKSIETNSYENELIQVLINIINNAIDILTTKEINDRYIFIDSFTEDENIIILIKDSAQGIDENIISRIFEPYFTTKHQSQGTGIGLYMSLEIISKHLNGELTVSNQNYSYGSKKLNGAEFKIKFPKI